MTDKIISIYSIWFSKLTIFHWAFRPWLTHQTITISLLLLSFTRIHVSISVKRWKEKGALLKVKYKMFIVRYEKGSVFTAVCNGYYWVLKVTLWHEMYLSTVSWISCLPSTPGGWCSNTDKSQTFQWLLFEGELFFVTWKNWHHINFEPHLACHKLSLYVCPTGETSTIQFPYSML